MVAGPVTGGPFEGGLSQRCNGGASSALQNGRHVEAECHLDCLFAPPLREWVKGARFDQVVW
jgi:hypothetical protein